LSLRALLSQGYDLIGPTIREGGIVYDQVASTLDLPVGWTDEQQGGKYHLKRREDDAYFGYGFVGNAF
jgi:sulfhydrogenase subunit beta (sulfur reductase)